MPVERINPPTLASSPGSHAQVMVAGIEGGTRLVFVSAQLAQGPDGRPEHIGDHVAQARLAFTHFRDALYAAGAQGADVVQYRMSVVDYDPDVLAGVFAAGREVFTDDFPTAPSILVGVTALQSPEYLFAVEGIAAIG